MLGNCDKMVLISAPPNEWPQNNQIDDQKSTLNSNNNNMGSVEARVMDQKLAAISQEQQQQQQQLQKQQNQEPLRCPRCDSTNTKFCYYNNYSLSQPRHFCKACKRYWTRGGTLRNVPVGGGCRKNKRVKRPSNSCSSSSSLTNSSLDHATSVNSASSIGHGHTNNNIHDLISSASNHVNPLFYGLPTSHNPTSDINNFPFSRYDLQNPSQINGIGLGFPSMNGDNHHDQFRNGLGGGCGFHIPASKQIFQDLISSNPLLTTTSTSSSTPTISSLLASTLHLKGTNNFHSLLPSYDQDELQIKGAASNNSGGMFMKQVKMELEGHNRSVDHHHWNGPSQNQMDQNMGSSSSSDPSLMWGGVPNSSNNNTNLGAWLDPSNNLGSSVPSLI